MPQMSQAIEYVHSAFREYLVPDTSPSNEYPECLNLILYIIIAGTSTLTLMLLCGRMLPPFT